MKIYVVTADNGEASTICGVAIDYATAEKIVECEKVKEGIPDDWVGIVEYDTEDYRPLSKGLYPFEVRWYQDCVMAVPVSVIGFEPGRVYDGARNRQKCQICDVYAKDEEHAFALASELKEKIK